MALGALGELMTGIAAGLGVLGTACRWIYRRGQAKGRAEITRKIEQRNQRDIVDRLERLERGVQVSEFRKWRR